MCFSVVCRGGRKSLPHIYECISTRPYNSSSNLRVLKKKVSPDICVTDVESREDELAPVAHFLCGAAQTWSHDSFVTKPEKINTLGLRCRRCWTGIHSWRCSSSMGSALSQWRCDMVFCLRRLYPKRCVSFLRPAP